MTSKALAKVLAGKENAFLKFLEAQTGLDYDSLCEGAAHLTERELEVIDAMASGKKNREISADLKISSKTLDIHRANVMKKLGAKGANDLGRKIWLFKLANSLYPETLQAAKEKKQVSGF